MADCYTKAIAGPFQNRMAGVLVLDDVPAA
jgi:hypothetical protein